MLNNLADCTPREFLVQTNRLRKVLEKWLKKTNILNIRKTQPTYPENATAEQKQEILQEQVKENLSRMFDAILDEASDDTLELLALLCFVEPEDVNKHPMSEYISAVTRMITNRDVLSFFTSLMQLGQTSGSAV